MSITRTVFLTLMAMIAFAGNSLLARAALKVTSIDAATFTSIRLLSGALMLWILIQLSSKKPVLSGGSWQSAVALCVYAAGFSFAYIDLPTATGALILFGAVQATMMGYGFVTGERLHNIQKLGILLAIVGMIALFLPGIEAPPVLSSILMLFAGVAWGVYSIGGRQAGDPTQATAGNFTRAVPIAVLISLVSFRLFSFDVQGVVYAVLSGAVASAVGYAIWYSVLPHIQATSASIVQLSVPVIAAVGGVLFLGEMVTWRLALSSIAVLGGIGLVILGKKQL